MSALRTNGAAGPTHAIGIDIGGTNLRLALYDVTRLTADRLTVPEALVKHRQPVGENRSPEALADTVVGLLASALEPWAQESGVALADIPVGIGIAAMVRPDGVVANAPNLGWRDVPFLALMRERLGAERTIGLYNDVAAITYGEWQVGAGVGVDDLLAVFVGTGIGGGIVAHGRLLDGAGNCAGEIGHVKIAHGDDARLCGCGMRGCVEAYVGGTHVQARARRELAGGTRSLALALAGGDAMAVHPGHLDAAAAQGDAFALELYAELAPLLAVALGNAVTLLNPARLILGGGLLSSTPIFREHVLTALQLAVTPALSESLSIVDPALGDDAGMVGSALLAARPTRPG